MKMKVLLAALGAMIIGLGACQSSQPEYCTVKGTVKGIKNGTKLVLEPGKNTFSVAPRYSS